MKILNAVGEELLDQIKDSVLDRSLAEGQEEHDFISESIEEIVMLLLGKV